MEEKFILNSGKVSCSEVEEKGIKKFMVEGYISTGDKDLVNDIVTDKCMQSMANQLKEKSVKLDIEHESFRGNSNFEMEMNKTIVPVGRITDFNLDQKGLKVQAEINPHHGRFQEVWGSLKDGYLDAYSIAYIPTSTDKVMKGGEEVRLLDNVNLLNVALTGNPVNPAASMTTVMAKSLEFMKAHEDSYSTDVDNIDTLKGGKIMAKEEPKKKKEEEMDEEEAKKEKKKYPQKKDDAESKPAESAEASEPKDAEVKSELEAVKKELAEVKAILEKPQVKAISQDAKAIRKETEAKATGSMNPLDLF